MLALVDAFEQRRNPFLEDIGEMLDLDQSLVIPPHVVNNMRKVKDIGLQLYTEFLNNQIFLKQKLLLLQYAELI